MFKSNPPYAIWSIWLYLPLLQKLLFLALCVLAIYSLVSAAVTMARLRTINTKVPQQKEDIVSIQRALAALRKRFTKLQQFTGAAFYLFVWCSSWACSGRISPSTTVVLPVDGLFWRTS
jgi:hypothetical protein